MTDMFEKVAQAIYETRAATENISHSWAEVKEASSIAAMTEAKKLYLLAIMEARAAIEAMREPSEAMLEAPWNDDREPLEQGSVALWCWEAMIDAALSETGE